jgi:hypothetical protein
LEAGLVEMTRIVVLFPLSRILFGTDYFGKILKAAGI